MLYLLDANTLIDAKKRYYPLGRVPEFWSWLVFQGARGSVKVPFEIFEEIHAPSEKDDLALWLGSSEVKPHILLDEEADQHHVDHVIRNGYLQSPSEDDLEKMGRDPFLLSYACMDINNRTVVTTEVSKHKKQGANRKIPDVARDLSIRCVDTFDMLRELDFRTSWEDEI